MKGEQERKTGEFIRSLRESLKQSQQEFADMLFVERSTVSKWENGSSFPKNESLLLLCQKFDLTVDEILAGERSNSKNKTIRNNIILSIMNKERKTRLLNKYFIILLFIILFIFLVYYFFTTYNSIHVYLVYGTSTNYKINDGLLIMSNEKVYFKNGRILNQNNEYINANKIILYSINNNNEKIILFEGEPNELLVQNSNNVEFFDNFKNKKYYDNIYLTVKYEDVEEDIKMNVQKDFQNKSLFFKKQYSTKDSILNQEYYKINKDFIYNEEDNSYTLNKNNLEIIFFVDTNCIRISYINGKNTYIYEYNLVIRDLNYKYCVNNSLIINRDININSISKEDKELFNEFKSKYLDRYFSETINVN